MKVSTTIDWFRYSAKVPKTLKSIIPQLIDVLPDERIKPLPYYTHAVLLAPAGRIDWSVSNPKQGALVTFTGEDLRLIEMEGIDKTYLAEHVALRADLSATRVDLAVDCVGIENGPTKLYKAWQAGKAKTRAQKCTQIHGKDNEGNATGNTVYVGSREGDVFLRVYDKGLQAGLDDLLWCRIELELKKSKAKLATKGVASVGVNQTVASALDNYIEFPSVPWWREMRAGLPSADKSIMQGEQHMNKESSWLREQALPAVIQALLNREDFVIDAVIEALETLERWDNPIDFV